MAAPLVDRAFAKVNLTLRVRGRRSDGYHELDSLVVFARLADRLSFVPGLALQLTARGPTAGAAGPDRDNLVRRAAQALADRVTPLHLGHFTLDKHLPVAAGLGGGSADAAAALRLLARANRMAPDDPRLYDAAIATGADVPVCLDPRPRRMRGIGDLLTAPLALPNLPAVLVNPGVSVPTHEVFAVLRAPAVAGTDAGESADAVPCERPALLTYLAAHGNDLEPAAIALQPVIGDVLAALRALPGCHLARMSGSGATCFGLFDTLKAATAAAALVRRAQPSWWVRATILGAQPAAKIRRAAP
ncbi:MAG: 4-(cytidine 5'-diphospho)-2-C-methyl-D-erythritol kinase [Rhizobiales bacterium]|nr:4-(cytidine 5'-diphospho)-2-C-methyl-D-erythritol kinase [Hyphomicrobiales bacterium]